MAISLAAEILSGVKSLASMLVDTSMVSIMSMPSDCTLSNFEDERGRAIAMIIRDKAAILKTNGICLTILRTVFFSCFHGMAFETRRCGFRPLSSM